MPSVLTKSLIVVILAAASLAAGAQTLLTRIPLASFSGDTAAIDVAVDSATNRIYVPIQFVSYSPAGAISYDYFRVLVLDGATNQVVRRLAGFPAGSYYYGVAIDPVRNLIYVEMRTYSSGGVATCTVSAVDGQEGETVKTISLPTGDCGKMVADPVTGEVYIRAATELDVIESEETGSLETRSLLAPGYLGTGGLAVSPYVHRLYITYWAAFGGPDTEYLGFLDTLDDQFSQEKYIPAVIDASINPVVNPATGHIFGSSVSYDSSSGDSFNLVTVYNSSGSLLATIAPPVLLGTGDTILGLDVDPKANLAFVFTRSDITYAGFALNVIDGASNTVLSSAPLSLPSGSPESFRGGSVAVNPDTKRVYVPYNKTTIYPPAVNGTFYLNVYSEQ